jgi:hypothetical protein
MTDEEIERLHGDDKAHPIAVWRKEYETHKTRLSYIDWRADRKYYQVRGK